MPHIYTLRTNELAESSRLIHVDAESNEAHLHWPDRNLTGISVRNVGLRDGLVFTALHGTLAQPVKLLEDPVDPWIGLGVQVSGAIDSTMDHRRVNLAPGTFNLIREYECKSGSVLAGANGYQSIHFQLSLEFFNNILVHNEEHFPHLSSLLKTNDPFRLSQAPIGTSYAMQQIVADVLACPYRGNLQATYLESKFMDLFVLVSQWSDTKTGKDKDLFHAIRDYLDQHYTDALSLQGLSKEFGINDFKLKKGFKEHFQKTVFEYIFEKRMEHAYHSLANTHNTLHHISTTVGYRSPTHFATAFKKHFGVVPSRLRKS